MKELDPGTSLGIRDFEASLSSENGAILTREPKPRQDFGELFRTDFTVTSLRLLWENRSFLLRVAGLGLVLSTLFAFSIPNRYQSVAHLMPPDNHPSSGLGMAAAAFAGGLAGLGGFPSELLGLRSTSDLLVGVLGSRTVQDNLIQRFDLKKVYGSPRMKMQDARKALANSTVISIDRRNQIITIKVSDKSPQRAAALAQAYVEELNRTLAAVSTSAARRERIFLEDVCKPSARIWKPPRKSSANLQAKTRPLISRRKVRPCLNQQPFCRATLSLRAPNWKGCGRYMRIATCEYARCKHESLSWRINCG